MVASAPAFAQESGVRAPVEYQQTLSTSPIADILGWINAEYQRKLNETVTVGMSAGTFEIDRDNYRNAMAFVRYYPQEAALTGFFIGARAGIHRVSFDTFDVEDRRRQSTTTPAIGIDVGHDWLVGRKRNFHIGVGAGAMRLLSDDTLDLVRAYPTVRLNVGFAF